METETAVNDTPSVKVEQEVLSSAVAAQEKGDVIAETEEATEEADPIESEKPASDANPPPIDDTAVDEVVKDGDDAMEQPDVNDQDIDENLVAKEEEEITTELPEKTSDDIAIDDLEEEEQSPQIQDEVQETVLEESNNEKDIEENQNEIDTADEETKPKIDSKSSINVDALDTEPATEEIVDDAVLEAVTDEVPVSVVDEVTASNPVEELLEEQEEAAVDEVVIPEDSVEENSAPIPVDPEYVHENEDTPISKPEETLQEIESDRVMNEDEAPSPQSDHEVEPIDTTAPIDNVSEHSGDDKDEDTPISSALKQETELNVSDEDLMEHMQSKQNEITALLDNAKDEDDVLNEEETAPQTVTEKDEIPVFDHSKSVAVKEEVETNESNELAPDEMDNELSNENQDPKAEPLEVSVNVMDEVIDQEDLQEVGPEFSSDQVSVPELDQQQIIEPLNESDHDFEMEDVPNVDVETQLLTEPKEETFDFDEQMAKYQHDEPAEPEPEPEMEPVSVKLVNPEHLDGVTDPEDALYIPSPAPEPHMIPELDIDEREPWVAPEPAKQSKTKEIGVQTIILGSELKLGSSTKKKIARELGYYIPAKRHEKSGSSMSPILASKQMKSSSQKIAKIINEHKAQLKVIFDRYSNGLTNKIKLDGLTKMLKDRNILKKLSLVPEITKAFHKSSFTKVTPDSLTFDEFLQCIIRLANDLLSRKKKSKYRTAESRVSLFLAKLHLRPFPKDDEVESLSHIVHKDQQRGSGPQRKSIAQEISPNIHAAMAKNQNPNARDPHSIQMQYDYRLSEKQLDSEFDNYFNTGGFFSDANSASHTPSVPSSAGVLPEESSHGNQSHKMAANAVTEQVRGPISPKFKGVAASDHRRKQRSQSGHVLKSSPTKRGQHVHSQHQPAPPNRRASNERNRMKRVMGSKRVKPSPFAKQHVAKKRLSSYQELYQSTNDPMTHQLSPQRMAQEMGHEMHRSPLRANHSHQGMESSPLSMHSPNVYHQQPRPQMVSPTHASLHHQPHRDPYHQMQQVQPSQDYQTITGAVPSYDMAPPQHGGYNEYYEPQQRMMQHPQAPPMQHDAYIDYERQERELANQIHHLTEQEQRVVRSIHQRQQNQLNRAVPPRQRSNSYGRR